MTNKDKYLKEGASARDLFLDFKRYGIRHNCYLGTDNFEDFMNEQIKPTLTEDERVILRNIENEEYKNTIGREDDTTYQEGKLYLRSKYSEAKAFAISTLYNHLFQFIKERRRI